MGSLPHNTSGAGTFKLLGRLVKPLTGVALSLAASFAFAAGPVPMKIGTVVWIGYGPFYVADALDLFKKYNLKVSLQMFTDPALIPPAVASGAVDGAMLTYDQVIGQVATGQMQKVVMPIDYSNGGDAIVADKSVTKVADFKGKKIGFNPLSPSDFLLSYALKTAGLSDKDITPVSMTPEAVPAADAIQAALARVGYQKLELRTSPEKAVSLYQTMQPWNFSTKLLMRIPQHLVVFKVANVVWSDWGTREAIERTYKALNLVPSWKLEKATGNRISKFDEGQDHLPSRVS